MDYKEYIREQKGQKRVDMTLLFSNTKILKSLIKDMVAPFSSSKIDKVAAIDAIGFIFGTAAAKELNVGLALIRKRNTIAWSVKSNKFSDYSGLTKELEIAEDAVQPGDHILIIDDWSETGTQLKSAITLVEEAGGVVTGVSMAHIDEKVLQDKNLSKYKLHSAVKY